MEVTVVKVQHKEGTSVKGKPYAFYTVSVIDEDANVFGFNISQELEKKLNGEDPQWYEVRNETRTIDVEFRPKGFDCSGTIVAM